MISTLKGKVSPFMDDSDTPTYYIYQAKAIDDEFAMTSCVIEVNESGIVDKIFAAYNP